MRKRQLGAGLEGDRWRAWRRRRERELVGVGIIKGCALLSFGSPPSHPSYVLGQVPSTVLYETVTDQSSGRGRHGCKACVLRSDPACPPGDLLLALLAGLVVSSFLHH
jgi:hypothetical protein